MDFVLRWRLSWLPCLLLVACTATTQAPPATSPAKSQTTTLTVAAASSLTNAFKEVKIAFESKAILIKVNFNFAASGALQKQIEQGAPVDVFASAANQQMHALEKQNLLISNTYAPLSRNQLVIVTFKGKPTAIHQLSDLANPHLQRLAIGNPASVPAGIYAKQALGNLYLQLEREQKLVPSENVRQVLAYVEQGNADAGIVYVSDAAISKKVQVAVKIPPDATEPILYAIAVVKRSQHPQQALKFIQFVTGPKGQEILQKYGFLKP